MQKILIIHSSEGNLEDVVQGIAEGARSKGNQVDILSTKDNDKIVNFFPYDLVLAGSPTLGVFKGKVAPDLAPYLARCKRTIGKDAIAFVTPGAFGTTRALKEVMGELEKLGCVVRNFVSLKNKKEGIEFGQRL